MPHVNERRDEDRVPEREPRRPAGQPPEDIPGTAPAAPADPSILGRQPAPLADAQEATEGDSSMEENPGG